MTREERQKTSSVSQRWYIEGMDCAGCVRKVEAAVRGVEGVETVSANATLGSLEVSHKPDDSPSRQAIERAVRRLGYGIASDDTPGSTSSHSRPGAWWQGAKGRLVLLSGVLLMLAFVLQMVLPMLGNWPFVVATLVGLVPIAQAAWRALCVGEPFTIEMLMTIAAVGALAIDAAAESAVVVFLFAVGELLEGVAAARARRSIAALSDLKPSTAQRLKDGEPHEVPADTLLPGQWVLVRPGDRVPCDGRIMEGSSYLDESPVTGESVPRHKMADDEVFAGTVNLDDAIKIVVTRLAADNTIARIIRLVEEAQAAKAPVARFIDRFARWYMPAVVGLALIMSVVPPIFMGLSWTESLYRALAMLLIACPCALVISTPAAIAAGLSSGARRGLLIKGGAVLETLGKLKTIALDKTGTLTAGTPQVTDVVSWTSEEDEEGILRMAAALERESSHPIATAIVAYARQQAIDLPQVDSARAMAGQGVAGRLGTRDMQLVGPRHVSALLAEHRQHREHIALLERWGKTLAVLVEGDRLLGMIAVRDEPREDARAGIEALERLGVRVVMLSGDNTHTAAAIGQTLGIEAVGGMMPEDKARRVSEWQANGQGPVGKVGDGINDAPALAAADVGIAMGSGTDVALETADAALLRNRVLGIAELIDLSRATLRNVKANVALALGFKAIFLVTTALGITGLWIAVMADTGATVLVTLNAMRLLRHRFE